MTNSKDFMEKFMKDLENLKLKTHQNDFDKNINLTNDTLEKIKETLDSMQRKLIEQEISDLKEFLNEEEFKAVVENELKERNKECYNKVNKSIENMKKQ